MAVQTALALFWAFYEHCQCLSLWVATLEEVCQALHQNTRLSSLFEFRCTPTPQLLFNRNVYWHKAMKMKRIQPQHDSQFCLFPPKFIPFETIWTGILWKNNFQKLKTNRLNLIVSVQERYWLKGYPWHHRVLGWAMLFLLEKQFVPNSPSGIENVKNNNSIYYYESEWFNFSFKKCQTCI